ncbi:MAG: metallophosphoesterase [Verrucomicrobia bacterium]|nr:metallophosphoesterase [Verrucomicrobiota bacterium]
MEVGLISDTHGKMRPEALMALAGCAVIFHAGDVCSEAVLEDLASVAPCHAVAGNCDADPTLPLTYQQEVGGVRFLIHHGHLPVDVARFRPQVVVTGHTHVPKIERAGEVLYVNPGSAGPRRFNLPVTVARVTIRGGQAEARLIPLDVA